MFQCKALVLWTHTDPLTEVFLFCHTILSQKRPATLQTISQWYMCFWMICIHIGSASNLSSSVTFQTLQQLMDGAFLYQLCNITSVTRSLYPFPPWHICPFRIKSSAFLYIIKNCCFIQIENVLRDMLGDNWFNIFLPFWYQIQVCCSTSTHWVTCNVRSLFEMLQPSIWAFKINARLQGYFISLHFHCIHCKTVVLSMAKPF